ncbi:hypothetical protein RQN30_02365 [Arcanobacterium hippocoleae]
MRGYKFNWFLLSFIGFIAFLTFSLGIIVGAYLNCAEWVLIVLLASFVALASGGLTYIAVRGNEDGV